MWFFYDIILKMEIKECRVIENRKLEDIHFLLRVENNFSEKFIPGQFITVKIPPFFLRRPFSVCKIDEESISILYKVAGKGTECLSKKKKGEYLNIVGPCGNGFDIEKKHKNIWIIGGGVGVAPLIFLTEKLIQENKKVTFFYGARKRDLLFFEILPYGAEYIFSTEDGSYGNKGDILTIFRKFLKSEKPDIVFSAGPVSLLKKLSQILKKEKIPSYMAVEERMGCGMGICYGCVIKIKKGKEWEYKRVCKEGPVFKSEEIIWE